MKTNLTNLAIELVQSLLGLIVSSGFRVSDCDKGQGTNDNIWVAIRYSAGVVKHHAKFTFQFCSTFLPSPQNHG
jgi:hypothetical protein